MFPKTFVEFKASVHNLTDANGKKMVDLYPWFLNFYKKGETKGGEVVYYPVRGILRSTVIDKNTVLMNHFSIQFIKTDDFYKTMGWSGHANSFKARQFKEIQDEVEYDGP